MAKAGLTVGSCVKCGSTSHTIGYKKETNLIYVTCTRCGYVWAVRPLDEPKKN